MLKLVALFVAGAYAVPLVVFSADRFASLTVVAIYGWMVLVLLWPLAPQRTAVATLRDRHDEWPLRLSLSAVLFLAYIALRYNDIDEILRNIHDGTYLSYALERAIDRYTGREVVSARYQLGTIVFFVCCAAAGAVIARSVKRTHVGVLLIVAGLLIGLTVELSSLARSGVLMGLSFAASAYLATTRLSVDSQRPGQLAPLFSWAVALVVGVLIFGAYGRVHEKGDANEIVTDKLALYTAGSYAAFSTWFTHHDPRVLGFGLSTVASLEKALGRTYPQGFYEPVETKYGSSNIFLNTRSAIEDFGIIGGIVFYAALAALLRLSATDAGFFGYLLAFVVLLYLLFPFISIYYATTATVACICYLACELSISIIAPSPQVGSRTVPPPD